MSRRQAFRPGDLDVLEGRVALSTLTASLGHAAHVKKPSPDIWTRIDNYIQGRLKTATHHATPVAPANPGGIFHRG